MRLRNDPNAQKIIDEHPEIYIHNPQQHFSQWNKLFANENPIHVEIGSGKGQFILNKAINNPDINFVGIEKCRVIAAKIYKKHIKELGSFPPNLKICNIDAQHLGDIFDKHEVSKIFLNFSDPWPKKRHHKHRLTHLKFLNLFHSILAPNSLIEFKTDNYSFFMWTLEQINSDWTIIYSTYDLYQELSLPINQDNVITEYEQRFVENGKKINKLVIKKN